MIRCLYCDCEEGEECDCEECGHINFTRAESEPDHGGGFDEALL